MKHLCRINNPQGEQSPIKPIDSISTSANWQHFHDEDGLCATILCPVHACTSFLHLTTHEHPTNRNGCPTNRHSLTDLNAVHLRYTETIARTQGTVYLSESRPLFFTTLKIQHEECKESVLPFIFCQKK